jgi:hypothetical protein
MHGNGTVKSHRSPDAPYNCNRRPISSDYIMKIYGEWMYRPMFS